MTFNDIKQQGNFHIWLHTQALHIMYEAIINLYNFMKYIIYLCKMPIKELSEIEKNQWLGIKGRPKL